MMMAFIIVNVEFCCCCRVLPSSAAAAGAFLLTTLLSSFIIRQLTSTCFTHHQRIRPLLLASFLKSPTETLLHFKRKMKH